MKLQDRVAVVTGGASGIGLAIAMRFVAEGAKVMLADVNATAGEANAKTLGDAAAFVEANLSGEAGAEAMVAATISQFGKLDIGVNAAGIGTLAPIVDHSIEQWDSVLNVNLRGVFLATKHEARAMREQGFGGVIINIASINARQPGEGMAAYCSSKAAVEMFTKVAAMELGTYGIRVAGIGPGLVDTPLAAPLINFPPVREEFMDNIPFGRMGTTEDIANAALFLASDEASWVTGTTLFVDGAELTKRYPSVLTRFLEAQRSRETDQ